MQYIHIAIKVMPETFGNMAHPNNTVIQICPSYGSIILDRDPKITVQTTIANLHIVFHD